MLIQLRVDNYVLIHSLSFEPGKGFNIITGETGAGKSILIGALGLILGDRADSKTVSGQDEKCIVEGVFDVRKLNLKPVFEEHDLDYMDETILRREILPSGKSRAFINDTPVNLNTMREIGVLLVDIHSQHQSLRLGNIHYLFDWLDTVSGCSALAREYADKYNAMQTKSKQLADLKQKVEERMAEKDYFSFLLDELEEIKLDDLDEEAMDEEFSMLQNAEEIGETISSAVEGLRDSDDAALDRINTIVKELKRLSTGGELAAITERISSAGIELEEALKDLSRFQDNAQPDPERLEQLDSLMGKLHQLKTKHRATSVEELREKRDEISKDLLQDMDREEEFANLEADLKQLETECSKLANELHNARSTKLDGLNASLNKDLKNLGLVNARIELQLTKKDENDVHGISDFVFGFASNVGMPVQPVHKIASGGELSRIMLIMKSYLARNKDLPCIIFDEIDTGVSGEVALKMAETMSELANQMQVISITHLPQIASKGKTHFYVYKELVDGKTSTFVKQLNDTERVTELAKMLSGEKPTEGAIANARELLN